MPSSAVATSAGLTNRRMDRAWHADRIRGPRKPGSGHPSGPLRKGLPRGGDPPAGLGAVDSEAVRKIAGAVLAAGSGRRMGGPKAQLLVAGERLVDRAVAVLRAAGCRPVLAVVASGVEVPGATGVVNPDPARGMRSSLALAVEAADGADALAVVLVDTPGVGAAAVRAVLDAWRPGRIARARFAGGPPGHPIVMSVVQWRDALARALPDGGARPYLRAHPELIDDVEVAGDPHDLDTADDLARWRRDSRR